MRLRSALASALACSALLLAACTGGGSDSPLEASPLAPTLNEPTAATTVVEGSTPSAIALATSNAFFASAPVVVLADDDDVAAQQQAASFAVELGVPMLLATAPPATPTPTSAAPATTAVAPTASAAPSNTTPAEVVAEIERLRATTVAIYGAEAAAVAESLGVGLTAIAPADATPANGDLPETERAEPVESVLALAVETAGMAAGATARSAGAELRQVTSTDPRADRDLIKMLAADKPRHVVALGSEFGPVDRLEYRVGVASTGVELPGGGQVLYPYRRHVALYGNPTTPALGALGEKPLPQTITRVQQLAGEYQELADLTIVPTFEVITTVASSGPGDDGNYSAESDPQDIRPYVDAAAQAGIHVVLDLQPGRSDFLTQAKLYEEFLKQPHVGLALDPEWRLEPDQVHLRQIGSVSAAEINSVVTWLADLTRDNKLPQKLLILHQFTPPMISDRAAVDTSRDELAVLIHVDGFGPPGAKLATWNNLRANPPPGIWWGWKNFIDEDSPLFTPAETLAIEPVPHFISYQ